jgi:hypothetical protein
MLPYGITGAAALAIVSGFYLIMQGQTVWKKTHLASVSDEEAQNQRVQTVKHSPSESLATATKENVVVATQKQVSPILVDQVQQSAMAPMKLMPESDSVPKVELENLENSKIPAAREVKAPSLTTSQTTNANSPSFTVRVRLKKVNLHSGPGMSFPVVGSATPESVYTVADWSDRWFQISPKTATSAKTVGWIRNDLVQIINPGSAPARVASPDLNPFR